MALLEVHGLHAGYGKLEVLHGITLQVEAGRIVSIIGPNGAGKSTVFKAIFGLLPVRHGRVLFAGEEVTNRSPEALLRQGMAFVPQGRKLAALPIEQPRPTPRLAETCRIPSLW